MFKLAVALISLASLVTAQVPVWGQCGGIGYAGSTVCAAGNVCTEYSAYYSQCIPGSNSAPPPPPPPTTTVSSPSSSSGTGTAPTGLSSIPASTLFQFSNFGTNPNNVAMYVYKPKKVQSSPPLIVASHYCQGSAQAYYSGSKFAQLAETYGYVVIYPSSPHSGTCWDVSSDETLMHNGGSDSLSIANAARFAVSNWGVDPNRVFAVGTSSGAMMTSVLAGAYPDVFKAGIVDSGVAFGCFAVTGQPEDSWNSQCAEGQLILTGQQWAQKVTAAYPGYTGARPKMQVWHGTADTTLYPQNFYEEIKQWTTIFGYPSNPISNATESYLPGGYSNATYGPDFQAILAQGVGHTVPLYEQQYLQFLGIA
ncbi:carbohydrate esterase family 1 protein [Phanerochaete carnosa HHB-10118-sp]|uniref:Carboxylic ester hydrolase n=1 Tax=Phanerochaete carnosa (strain HHB-10118-sp) TaxID=650164 RepID=K5VZA3_PHACS|nr:carbohydrate esterase family 1 protein [Phanerochaete carnosa HHB-10118-sp]EKM51934.1 carbohydrate esterase family 1 protein [Phanerochaete carnosa HHB-10118-sp]